MYQGKFEKEKGPKPVKKPVQQKPAAKKPVYKSNAVRKTAVKKRAPVKKKGKVGTIVFYSILLCGIVAFFVGLSFVMNALNDWLVRFEASQPTVKCEEVFGQLFRNPDWQNIYELAGEESDSVTAEDYEAYMRKKVGTTQLSYIETSAGLSGDKKYIVRSGTEKVATFTLCNAQPDADIPDWQLGTVEIFYSCDLSVTILAEPGYTVLVDGTQLDESHVVSSVATKAENYLPQGVHGYRMNELQVSELLMEPEVQVLAPDGTPVELSYDSENGIYSPVTDTLQLTEQDRQALTAAAETYCKYMIGAANRTGLKKCFDPDSEIYETITTNTTWMQNYQGYELGEASIDEYYRYNDQLYSARVSLTLEVTRKDGTVKEYDLNNTFFMESTGDGSALVTEMINSNAQETVTTVRLTYVSEGETLYTEMVDAGVNTLTPPAVTAPEGKSFAGWFTETVDENGVKTMELAFEPDEDGTVRLSADSVLEPMTLYALYQ